MKTETEDQLSRIFIKALKANEETKAAVFLRFSGHVNMIEVDIHKGGWHLREKQDIRKGYDFNYDGADELNAMEAVLDKLLEGKQ